MFICLPIIGSSPVVGSSRISISGFWRIALANPILFWTPIERLEGNSCSIDFGSEIGIKKSSAQLIKNYTVSNLINKQIAAVINFEPKQIGNLISEVLVLGFPDADNEPILIVPDLKVKNGGKLY